MLNPSQSDSDINSRHNNRMIRKKNIVDEKIAKADRDKGLILVHTGNGKGKSSAAFGMVARTLGHGLRVAIRSEERRVGKAWRSRWSPYH